MGSRRPGTRFSVELPECRDRVSRGLELRPGVLCVVRVLRHAGCVPGVRMPRVGTVGTLVSL